MPDAEAIVLLILAQPVLWLLCRMLARELVRRSRHGR